jgi:hypothetical protein
LKILIGEREVTLFKTAKKKSDKGARSDPENWLSPALGFAYASMFVNKLTVS